MSNLQDPHHLLDQVHPDLRRFAFDAANDALLDLFVVTGARTQTDVTRKYAEGRTSPGPHAGEPGYPELGEIVTNAMHLAQTAHSVRLTPEGRFGCAIDLQFISAGKLNDGKSEADQALYRWMGELAESRGFTWGGRFPKVDQAHIELKAWRAYPLISTPTT